MKIITVRVEKNDFDSSRYDVTVQTKGYPKTLGFLEELGETNSLDLKDAKELAVEVYNETKEANPDAKVILQNK